MAFVECFGCVSKAECRSAKRCAEGNEAFAPDRAIVSALKLSAAGEYGKLGRVRDDITESTARACLAELERRYKDQAKPYLEAIVAAKALEPSVTPILCGGCGAPVGFHPILGSRCECSKKAEDKPYEGPIWGPGPSEEERRALQVKVVRDALRHTGDHNLKVAAGLASDEACLHLKRLLK